MGWACKTDAMDTLRQFKPNLDKSNNTWQHKGERYFYEVSRTEHSDGAITGTIYRYVSTDRVRKAGSFRIEGDGRLTRSAGGFAERIAEGKRTGYRNWGAA